jgi:FAD/FMN-containing dehydrogenase
MIETVLIDKLCSIVGAANVIQEDLDAYETDWRKMYAGRALAVVRPASSADVSAVMNACSGAGISVVPQGGNTGLVGGSTPDASGDQVVLSTRRMNRIIELDARNQTLTVEAGCVLQAVQEFASTSGWLFPLSLAAEGSCTIGGNLASNAGGTQVLRYGNARELCLGIEVVTPDGRLWQGLTGLRKDNTGYDLRNLYIGSEGTLGVITAATLKLFPKPAARLTAWAAVPSADAAVTLLELAREKLGTALTGFELMGQEALRLVDKQFSTLNIPLWKASPWCVLLEHSDQESEAHAHTLFEGLLESALEQGAVTDAVVAQNLAESKRLWHTRESIPLAQAQEGYNIKHDISVPISRISSFLEETDRAVKVLMHDARLITLGHAGDGNLHYNIQAPVSPDGPARLSSLADQIGIAVYDAVAAVGGSISAEHGIGAAKLDVLPAYKSPVSIDLMRDIKAALDPSNIMNPGRVIRR